MEMPGKTASPKIRSYYYGTEGVQVTTSTTNLTTSTINLTTLLQILLHLLQQQLYNTYIIHYTVTNNSKRSL
jgi:hypothetical protein